MDTVDKVLSLEETLQLLDAYPSRLSQTEETLEPVDADPDPAAIDAAMQMLVDSGWTFEGVSAASCDADALTMSDRADADRNAAGRSEEAVANTPSSAISSTAPASTSPSQGRITVLDDIDLLLSHQRGRKREQLIQLRAIAQALEGRLLELRQANLTRSAASIQPDAGRTATQDARVWQQIAERQYKARRRVEQENARLRASLQAQIEVARRLERLLKRQQPRNLP